MSKVFVRYYTIADFEEEEIFLRNQARKGLRFKNVIAPCFYVFEECEPEDVVYRIDFKNSAVDDEYKQMFADFGWEYAGKVVGWTYFRKPASEMTEDSEDEIFSDSESKIAMIEKVIMRRMLPILVIFLCIVVPFLAQSISKDAGVGITVFLCLILVFYVYLVSHCSFKLIGLKRKYQK